MEDTALGDRMKMYEKQYSGARLLPLMPICARIDGRAFHTFTMGLERPFDRRLSGLMVDTTKHLVEETGAIVGYTQSDEISLIWYSEKLASQTFFNRSVLKMVSVLSSMATAYFNSKLADRIPEKVGSLPTFDARVWNVPLQYEAVNYLIWREMDATRNSITMAAHHYYSHNELQGVSSSQKQEMLFKKGVNWNNYPTFFKRGTYVQRRVREIPFTAQEIERLPPQHLARRNPSLMIKRQRTELVEWPPLASIKNRNEVVFEQAKPVLGDNKDVALADC